jgi:predicted ester cyclase
MTRFATALAALLLAGNASLASAQTMSEPPAPPGTVAYNTWLGRTFSEVMLNTRDDAARARILERIVATGYIQHNMLVPQGRQGLIDFIPFIYQAMPDARFVLHDVFATSDRVVTRWTWTGTVTGGPFLGVAPRGQKLEFDVIDVWRVEAGMLAEHWDQFDWPRAMIQLGITGLPQPFIDVAARPVSR